MGWAKFDDGFTEHPKVVAAGPWGELLAMRGVIYAARYETDGFIPSGQLPRLSVGIPAVKRRVSELISVGLWEETDGGWLIHDFLDYHPSKAEREEERQAARERMRNVRANKTRTSDEVPPQLARSSDYPDPTRTPKEAKASSFTAFNAERAVEAVRQRQKKGLPVTSPPGLARTIAADPDHVAESQRIWGHRDCEKCDGTGFLVFHPQAGGTTQAPCDAGGPV